MNKNTMVVINVKTLSVALFSAIGLLLVMHLAGIAWLANHNFELDRWSWIFNFGYENNLPSLFSFALLMLNGLCLLLVAHASRTAGRGFTAHWFILGFIFIALALDEALALHEVLGEVVQATLNTQGFLYFAWVIPYGAFVLVLGVVYLRFFLNLPRPTQTRFVVAAATFLTGAVGLEMIESAIHASCQEFCWADIILVTIEEALEMVGAALFIRALALYLSEHGDQFSLH